MLEDLDDALVITMTFQTMLMQLNPFNITWHPDNNDHNNCYNVNALCFCNADKLHSICDADDNRRAIYLFRGLVVLWDNVIPDADWSGL